MSLRGISYSQLSWTGVVTGIFWGMLNLGINFLFQSQELEGSLLGLILSFSTAGALLSSFVLFLAVWFGETAEKNPYSTVIKISLFIWFVSVFFGGVFHRLDPERYHFNWVETLWGGVKVFLLGTMLGWGFKRLIVQPLVKNSVD